MNSNSQMPNDLPEMPRVNRRRKSFWEPIFTSEELEPFPFFDWKVRNITGIHRQMCRADQLNELRKSEAFSTIRSFKFSECDFFGSFGQEQFTFKECSFDLCDLGRSTWQNVKFQNCTFRRCSLTQSTFESCQFLNCSWSEIGLSGNETLIKDCLFTAPSEFVMSGYTNLDPKVLLANKKTATYQTMRLEQTKLKIARLVLTSLESHGDDIGYYQAVKTYLNQNLDARMAEIKHDLSEKKHPLVGRLRCSFLRLEKLILNVSGSINNWGASIAQPAIVGAGLIACFAMYYRLFGIQSTWLTGFIASFDVTTLVGYTKHASKDGPISVQLSYLLNMLLGLWWYAIFVPTVINRISRVRA